MAFPHVVIRTIEDLNDFEEKMTDYWPEFLCHFNVDDMTLPIKIRYVQFCVGGFPHIQWEAEPYNADMENQLYENIKAVSEGPCGFENLALVYGHRGKTIQDAVAEGYRVGLKDGNKKLAMIVADCMLKIRSR